MPELQETWVWSLGWEDTLEKEIATHSSILAWRIPWIEEPDGLQSMGSQEPDSSLLGFYRQEYWSELSFSSPGDLPDPGIEPGSPGLNPCLHCRQILYWLSYKGSHKPMEYIIIRGWIRRGQGYYLNMCACVCYNIGNIQHKINIEIKWLIISCNRCVLWQF